MVNGYVENLLKRNLKKKVKVTLSLLVTFLITGTALFAEDMSDKKEEFGKYQEILNEVTKNFYNIGNYELSNFNKTVEDTEIKIEDTNKIIIGTKTININKDDLTKNVKDKIENVFDKVDTKLTSAVTGLDIAENQMVNGKDSFGIHKTKAGVQNIVNSGIIISTTNGQYSIIENSTLTNEGIIIANTHGQYLNQDGITSKYSEAINNGIISAVNTGQRIRSEYSTLINNGLILAKDGQYIDNGGSYSKLINNGIISVTTEFGQAGVTGSNMEIFNYGIIRIASGQGQRLDGATNGKMENYGIIEGGNYGQIISRGTGNTSYNYGLINMTGTGNAIQTSNANNSKAYNYGVVKIKNASNAFSGNVTNKGIVIADTGNLQPAFNTGIFLNSKYEVMGNDTKIFNNGDTAENFAENDTFGEYKKGFVKNESIKIENIQGKVLGAVVTKDSELKNAVFNYEGEDLFLKDTSVVGYFEKNGTLLDVGSGNLTLAGDTNITAVKGDLSLDVYAVEIGKNGKVTIADEAKINGIIKGYENSEIIFSNSKGTYNVTDSAVNIEIQKSNESKYLNYFDFSLVSDTPEVGGSTVKGVTISTENAVKDMINKLEIENGVTVEKIKDTDNAIVDTNTDNFDAELNLTIKDINNIKGNILLGAGKDTVIVNNVAKEYENEINLGTGTEDKFIVNGISGINTFNYHVANAETVELNGGTWGNWKDAEGTIKFTDDNSRDNTQLSMVLGNSTTMNITLNSDKNGSDFANYVDELLGDGNHAYITGKENSTIKFIIGNDGLASTEMSSDKYSFDDKTINVDSGIFNIVSEKDNGTKVSIKTAEELKLSGQERIIYDAYIKKIMADSKDEDVINQVNKNNNSTEEFVNNIINKTQINGEAYYTAGSVVTKDITDSYLSAVEDFKKRAGKGEWIAQGKYINSDTEFDGGSKVKGYDGDITGTVGMIEYGVTENTSYGAVFGKGDAEININGGGKLDGDNIYAGLYMKHKTQNNIDLIGNIGYIKSDMDSDLRSDFTAGIVEGDTFEKGTADSSAIVLSLKGRKDYKISDSVKVQPMLGARVFMINQEKAENPEMHFEISEQDIIVLEGTAGMGIAKEFMVSHGVFELNGGIEYTLATSNTNNNADYTLFDTTTIKLEDSETAENRGTVYAGFDYEHESGVGFNGKYEMMWSDKGDDSRITAGISYRF